MLNRNSFWNTVGLLGNSLEDIGLTAVFCNTVVGFGLSAFKMYGTTVEDEEHIRNTCLLIGMNVRAAMLAIVPNTRMISLDHVQGVFSRLTFGPI